MRLAEIREAMCVYSSGFDAGALTGTEALLRLREVTAIENTAATIKALLAARLAETEIHRGSGDRSAADLLARETGTTLGAARDAIATGRQLEDQPLLN